MNWNGKWNQCIRKKTIAFHPIKIEYNGTSIRTNTTMASSSFADVCLGIWKNRFWFSIYSALVCNKLANSVAVYVFKTKQQQPANMDDYWAMVLLKRKSKHRNGMNVLLPGNPSALYNALWWRNAILNCASNSGRVITLWHISSSWRHNSSTACSNGETQSSSGSMTLWQHRRWYNPSSEDCMNGSSTGICFLISSVQKHW